MKSPHLQMLELRHEIESAGFCAARVPDCELEAAVAKFTEQIGRMPNRETLRDRAARELFFDALWPRPAGAPF